MTTIPPSEMFASLPKVEGLRAYAAMKHLAHLPSQEPPVLTPQECREAQRRLIAGAVEQFTESPLVLKEVRDGVPVIVIYGNKKHLTVNSEATTDISNMGIDTTNAVVAQLFHSGVCAGARDFMSVRDQL